MDAQGDCVQPTTSSNYVRNDHYLYGQTVDVTLASTSN